MFSIATINVQNKYKLKKYNGLSKGKDHIALLFSLIQKYNLQIIGLQEVNPWYRKRLEDTLPASFSCYGKTRYPQNRLLEKIEILSKFNESTPILTNQKVLRQTTKTLPWIRSYVPRVVTIMELELEEVGVVTVLNTHLDFLKNKTKVKQLHKLQEIIEKIAHPVILLGDFNMTLKNQDLLKFIQYLQEKNIYHVDIGEATYKKSKSNAAIDHIFLSSCFQVEKVYLEKGERYQEFSDHYPVIAKISLGFLKK